MSMWQQVIISCIHTLSTSILLCIWQLQLFSSQHDCVFDFPGFHCIFIVSLSLHSYSLLCCQQLVCHQSYAKIFGWEHRNTGLIQLSSKARLRNDTLGDLTPASWILTQDGSGQIFLSSIHPSIFLSAHPSIYFQTGFEICWFYLTHHFSVVVNCGFLCTNKNGYTILRNEPFRRAELGLKMRRCRFILCRTTPIILRRCLERTNVYCYYKAAFVVIACALCPLLLVSALLSFCARLRGLVQPAASAARWLEREGGRAHLSRTLCFIFIKRAAFDLLPLWRVTLWTAAPHCC